MDKGILFLTLLIMLPLAFATLTSYALTNPSAAPLYQQHAPTMPEYPHTAALIAHSFGHE